MKTQLQLQADFAAKMAAMELKSFGQLADELKAKELALAPVVSVIADPTTPAQKKFFKDLEKKYKVKITVPATSKESRIKLTAILKAIKCGRVQLRVTGYTGRDAECLVGAMDQR